jgi:hypothetical protein
MERFGDQLQAAIWGTRIVYTDSSYPTGTNVDVWVHDLLPAPVLTTPNAASTFYRDMPKPISGFISPTYPAGSGPVLVHLWKQNDSGSWTWRSYVRAASSDVGYDQHTRYSATVEFPSVGSWRVRAYVPADGRHAAWWSETYDYVTVSDVIVGTPNAPETMRDDTSYTVRGYLKPRHTAGTKPVRIYKWKRLSGGTWESRGYKLASVYDYSTYSRYKASVSFSSAGRWRVRAYHPKDATHRARWSKYYDYVTVTR